MREKLEEIENKFDDVDALGVFVENHDNQRFLHRNGNVNRFKNAIAFTLFTRGIPIIYYGMEQGFNGGDDPNNRESLWNAMNDQSDLYLFI